MQPLKFGARAGKETGGGGGGRKEKEKKKPLPDLVRILSHSEISETFKNIHLQS